LIESCQLDQGVFLDAMLDRSRRVGIADHPWRHRTSMRQTMYPRCDARYYRGSRTT
jgi:hypothetical protein